MAAAGAAPHDPLPPGYDGKVDVVEKIAELAYAAGRADALAELADRPA